MMTKEEVAEIMTFCKEKGVSYKSRLAELGIPEWKFSINLKSLPIFVKFIG